MKPELRKKLLEGVLRERNFLLPGSFGPGNATHEEAFQLLETTWEEFRALDLSQIRETEAFLVEREQFYDDQIRLNTKKIAAARERKVDKYGWICLEMEPGWHDPQAACRYYDRGSGKSYAIYVQYSPEQVEEAARELLEKMYDERSLVRYRLSMLRAVREFKAFGPVPTLKELISKQISVQEDAHSSLRGEKPEAESPGNLEEPGQNLLPRPIPLGFEPKALRLTSESSRSTRKPGRKKTIDDLRGKVIPTLRGLLDFISDSENRTCSYTCWDEYMAKRLPGLTSGNTSVKKRVDQILNAIRKEWGVPLPLHDCYKPACFFDMREELEQAQELALQKVKKPLD